MLIKERMTLNPIVITPDVHFQDALNLMREKKVRRLPVIENENLVGIISEKDLLYASPSSATSLSVHEMTYLLSKLKVSELMKKDVITISPDKTLEDGAIMMIENKIGALPVIEEYQGKKRLIGIITETDIFKIFVEMLGAKEGGIRATFVVPDKKGELASILTKIAEKGGNIISVSTFKSIAQNKKEIVVRIKEISKTDVENLFKGEKEEIIKDIRET